jgi:hypothetical protein
VLEREARPGRTKRLLQALGCYFEPAAVLVTAPPECGRHASRGAVDRAVRSLLRLDLLHAGVRLVPDGGSTERKGQRRRRPDRQCDKTRRTPSGNTRRLEENRCGRSISVPEYRAGRSRGAVRADRGCKARVRVPSLPLLTKPLARPPGRHGCERRVAARDGERRPEVRAGLSPAVARQIEGDEKSDLEYALLRWEWEQQLAESA